MDDPKPKYRQISEIKNTLQNKQKQRRKKKRKHHYTHTDTNTTSFIKVQQINRKRREMTAGKEDHETSSLSQVKTTANKKGAKNSGSVRKPYVKRACTNCKKAHAGM